jgi:hypothetical protein
MAYVSNYHNYSLCVFQWVLHSMKQTKKNVQLSSITYCLALTTWRLRLPCLTQVLYVHSCRAAITTIDDDLYDIYGAMRDNAMLSKWAGGLGNDWTPVRALNSYIKGTNGKSQGVVPFLKVRTILLLQLTKVVSVKVQSVHTLKLGTWTSKNS